MPVFESFAWGAAALLVLVLAGTTAAAPPAGFTGLVVLGDSLSDSGNAGRASNGPVWVEHLAERLGLPLRPAAAGGTNHAVGGARIEGDPTDLRAQADRLLAAHRGRLDPDALYVVWGGGNDLLGLVGAAGSADPAHGAQAAARALGGIVSDLAAAGARHILVPNLPDVGMTPAVRAHGASAMAQARRLSLAFDAALEQALGRVEAERGVAVRRLDVSAMAERVLADPAAAGFRDVTTPCLGGNCEGFVFWDDVHPTTAAHARLAEAALSLLRPAATPAQPAGARR